MIQITCELCKNKMEAGDGVGYYLDQSYRRIRVEQLTEAEFHLCKECEDSIGWGFVNRNREKIKQEEETPF